MKLTRPDTSSNVRSAVRRRKRTTTLRQPNKRRSCGHPTLFRRLNLRSLMRQNPDQRPPDPSHTHILAPPDKAHGRTSCDLASRRERNEIASVPFSKYPAMGLRAPAAATAAPFPLRFSNEETALTGRMREAAMAVRRDSKRSSSREGRQVQERSLLHNLRKRERSRIVGLMMMILSLQPSDLLEALRGTEATDGSDAESPKEKTAACRLQSILRKDKCRDPKRRCGNGRPCPRSSVAGPRAPDVAGDPGSRVEPPHSRRPRGAGRHGPTTKRMRGKSAFGVLCVVSRRAGGRWEPERQVETSAAVHGWRSSSSVRRRELLCCCQSGRSGGCVALPRLAWHYSRRSAERKRSSFRKLRLRLRLEMDAGDGSDARSHPLHIVQNEGMFRPVD